MAYAMVAEICRFTALEAHGATRRCVRTHAQKDEISQELLMIKRSLGL